MTTRQDIQFTDADLLNGHVEYLPMALYPGKFPTGGDYQATLLVGACRTLADAEGTIEEHKTRTGRRIAEGEAIIARNGADDPDRLRDGVAYLRAIDYAIYTRTVGPAVPA